MTAPTDAEAELVVTKLGHACVRLERGASRLVVDPGVFSDPGALEGAGAVLITHQHPDHLDPARVSAAIDADPGLQVWGPADAVDRLGGPGERLRVAATGDRFTAAGFEVAVVGEWHAVIHPDIPPMRNVGYLIDGLVLHPGDALTVLDAGVDTLLLPVCAPWLKLGEVIDYVRAVAPRQALPVHDTTYSAAGLAIVHRQLGPDGVGIAPTTYVNWADGDRVVVPAAG